jgi:penicillin amidase
MEGSLIAVLLTALLPAPAAGQPVPTDTLRVPRLGAPVEIVRDAWGIPHIYAQSERDLFFAQGFAAARDRLFQLEMWRRRATGTMAEVFGPEAVDHDVGARLLRYRGDMEEELRHYHPRGAEIISAFVNGVNAYIALAERDPSLLPIEFRLLDFRPGRWTPAVVVSRHNGLFRNADTEVELARLVPILGGEQVRELLDLHPGLPRLVPDAAVALERIPDGVLRRYQASRAPIPVGPEDVTSPFRGASAQPEAAQPLAGGGAGGSNNWVVAGRRTFSGGAVMANDPHRVIAIPALRYWVHLVAPGWNVIGGGEPALPGVAIGHNEHGAWGLTIFGVDQEDLYVYDLDPDRHNRYRFRGAWEEMIVERDTIRVRGAAPVPVDLRYTRHGPVLLLDSAERRAYALRAAWLEPGAAPYLASLRMDQAATWEEFRAACAYFRTPSENMVWADTAGTIGWQATGITPLRRGWDGLLPVPGDGRYEWEGFLPILELPHEADPERGWIATANEHNLPRGYAPVVGFEWEEPYRAARLAEVLGSGRRHTLADMQALQQDELALPARALIPLLDGLDLPDSATRAAAARLREWDLVMDRESEGATIYAFWERRLRERVWARVAPEATRALLPASRLALRYVVGRLTAPDGRLGLRPTEVRDEIVTAALREAVAELDSLLGPDQRTWRYGRLKHVRLAHPLSGAVNAETRARLDLGPLPRGGHAHTVNYTSSALNQQAGASFRIIVDTSDWDGAVGTTTPGQSGDPESAHYADLFASWAAGRYFPVLFSRDAVRSAAEAVTVLTP